MGQEKKKLYCFIQKSQILFNTLVKLHVIRNERNLLCAAAADISVVLSFNLQNAASTAAP